MISRSQKHSAINYNINTPCEEDSMIIAPTATPAALLDQSSLNQSQQQQTQNTELSRKASVTVQLSPEARELAGAENKETPQQQRQEASQKTSDKPVIVQFSSASRELAAAENKPTTAQQQIEVHVTKQFNQALEVNQQQPINPSSKQPEHNKIQSMS